MKNGIILLIFGISAIILTSLAYIIDTDPPYADFTKTVIEFSIITLIFFGFFVAVFYISKFIKRLIKT